MNQVIIGVGSNISPYAHIDEARRMLARDHRFEKTTLLTRTKPIGYANQPDFINCAFLVNTSLERPEFRHYLKTLENRLGRKRTSNKNGPRTIDLDIAAWNGKIVDKNYYDRSFLRNAVDKLMEQSTGVDICR
ncbi:MAG: 2-amino-4-hydroxy-6-hydroxymethyldihydropteridine diphosphokinase [Chitinivibrionales bacterium]|nr:2-amino-4-hydroxy-6-hydroxymethyldihydropteridine diphosphokinase [Chitinivibrionales bacterium]